jgi:prophage regulatory protein
MSTIDTGPRLIRIKQIQHKTSLSRSHLYHLASVGKFPQSVSLVPGGSSRAWVQEEVDAWIEQRIAERNAGLRI